MNKALPRFGAQRVLTIFLAFSLISSSSALAQEVGLCADFFGDEKRADDCQRKCPSHQKLQVESEELSSATVCILGCWPKPPSGIIQDRATGKYFTYYTENDHSTDNPRSALQGSIKFLITACGSDKEKRGKVIQNQLVDFDLEKAADSDQMFVRLLEKLKKGELTKTYLGGEFIPSFLREQFAPLAVTQVALKITLQ